MNCKRISFVLACWLMSACALGTEEETAEPLPPIRPDGGSVKPADASYEMEEWPSTGGAAGGGTGNAGVAGIAGVAGVAGNAGLSGEGGNGTSGSGTAGAAGQTGCTPGETQDLGSCDKCGTLQNQCNDNGEWSSVCVNQKTCSPNSKEETSCGNCGTMSRTCNASCEWGDWGSCTGQGECSPNSVKDCMCSTNDTSGVSACCGQQVCSTSCKWSDCSLKPGKQCEWKAGHEWTCCGTQKWRWCLSSCMWSTDCVSCNGYCTCP